MKQRLIAIILLSLPVSIIAQELDDFGYKYVQKVYKTFLKGEKEALNKFYIPFEERNEMLMVIGSREMEKDMHEQSIERALERSLAALENAKLEVNPKSIIYDEAITLSSEDEDGIITLEIEVIGTDGFKDYIMKIENCVQFPDGKYYLTKELSLTVNEK